MSADFGYINARIRGLKSRLLGPEFYATALADGSFDSFLAGLGQTGYGTDLEEARTQASGLPAVDRALARNFYNTTRSILGFSDGWPHDLIALLLRRYDLANIKAVARAKHAGRAPEDTASALLPAGEMRPSLLDALVGAADIPALAQVLGAAKHPLTQAVRKAARAYGESGDLFTFEVTLDRAFHESIAEAASDLPLPESFRGFLDLELQATNLRTALKLRGRDVAAQEFFMAPRKSASAARSVFDSIIADTGDDGLSALADTRFSAVADTKSLGDADAAIRAVLDAEVRRLSLGDPLGPFVVLDFLRRKERELARLRLLARGTYYSVPREQLEQELSDGAA